ncbi:MAG: transposase [Paludibacteraceae bacterium]|nr:transposase [Paludibacteraceae bacterium]
MYNDLPKHNRRSIRLKNYDYSSKGLYFITICCKNMKHLFGEIQNDEMVLNDLGKIVESCWLKSEEVRPNIRLHNYVIMPNHFHAIVEITDSDESTKKNVTNGMTSTSRTIGALVRGFKGAVSRKIGMSIWHRNYYETIIRSAQQYVMIANYIDHNPSAWNGTRTAE